MQRLEDADFVAALDRKPQMRCVLGLFEGVVTAAADGYYRMADKPACTLLHLGPGLGNGLANMHNAKKAGSGMVNIVGEHATYHIAHNAPLTSDIEGVARPMSHWVQTCNDSTRVAQAGADATVSNYVMTHYNALLALKAALEKTGGKTDDREAFIKALRSVSLTHGQEG